MIPFLLSVLVFLPRVVSAQEDQPNIVLVFMDNFGWGEIGAYGGGILRGAATPNIDGMEVVQACLGNRFDRKLELLVHEED